MKSSGLDGRISTTADSAGADSSGFIIRHRALLEELRRIWCKYGLCTAAKRLQRPCYDPIGAYSLDAEGAAVSKLAQATV